ncbi:Inorganic pyrophosphatase [Smittium mucronatum]|uniref:Inorganic pyrophosphatase n=1 Tax=Smittium mucronatum TaxID=133383 RepID=A0A1R0H0F8_9FUNG|nr:Inorganic pyrophosphatase [Smittium mucronatum]
MSLETRVVGTPGSTDYRVYLEKDGKIQSFFHDVPLYANAEKTVLNMVVEIPRWTNAKLEIKTKDKYNPIAQDTKKGKLRYVANTFPHHGYIWNYGAFPQTWEDPGHSDENTGCVGDNDPLDVIEIGEKIGYTGQIKQVKVIGILAMIDEGETDWKVIAIDVTDPLASSVNDVEDIQTYFPGLLKASVEWFKFYKVPDGKPENQFGFGGQAKDKKFTNEIIEETHAFWKKLIASESNSQGLSTLNTIEPTSPHYSGDDAEDIKSNGVLHSAPVIDQSLSKWHFIKSSKI